MVVDYYGAQDKRLRVRGTSMCTSITKHIAVVVDYHGTQSKLMSVHEANVIIIFVDCCGT